MKANWLYRATANSDKSVIVHEGGTSSGKTYAILQHLATVLCTQYNEVITVVGQDIPNLKVGAYRDFQNIINETPFFQQNVTDWNKSNRTFDSVTGSTIEFNSYKDDIDARSGKRSYSFFNEANGISYDIFEQINMRTTKQTIIDFNPSAAFWAHDKLHGRDHVDWFNSTFRDNPFIKDSVVKKIMAYEPTPENIERGTANKYRWMVYGLGQVGRLEGLVFPDFKVSAEWPDDYKWRAFGMDFGFTNDPTTLIEMRYAHGNLYLHEHIYETGLTNPDISNRLKSIGFGRDEIVADSAEPKSIRELVNSGWNVKPAVKGPDSVNTGIDILKRYPLYITSRSKNLIEEFSSYTWKMDRDGKALNKPVDKYNHGIDAARYAISARITKPKLRYA